MVVSFFLSMYYNVINAWAFWYLFHSFQVCGRPAECLSPMEGPGGVVLVLDILQSHHNQREGTSSRNPPGSFLGEKNVRQLCAQGLWSIFSSPQNVGGGQSRYALLACGAAAAVGCCLGWGGSVQRQGRGSVLGERIEDKLQGRWAS